LIFGIPITIVSAQYPRFGMLGSGILSLSSEAIDQATKGKSAVSNGARLFIEGLDGRTALARRYRDLVRQLTSLERRVSRGVNRDNIDHPPNAHDDLANAVAGGVLVLAQTRPARVQAWHEERRLVKGIV
jgi:hypothetical protein